MTRSRILRLLRDTEGFVSSQEICRRAEVSRSAVWKQVEALRREGYQIQGVSSQGYRLDGEPDSYRVLETDPGITSVRIGKRITVKEETGSTNDDLWQLGQQGAEEGTVVIAEMQHAGRGRRGREWVGPAGRNLYFSVLLRPSLPPEQVSLITIMAAVQLCEVLAELFSLEPGIKWPNDVLLEGKKVAGILAEMHAEQEDIHFLVLGIGVNLNMPAEMFPKNLRYPATSVEVVLGRPVERVRFARRLMEVLDLGYDRVLSEGTAPVVAAWKGYCAHPHGWLRVDTPQGMLEGRFEGIDSEGAMILETGTEGPRKEKVRAGDVTRVMLGKETIR